MPSKAKVWVGILSLAAIALLPGVSTAASSKERQAQAQIWVLVDTYATKYRIPLTLARNLVRFESGGRQDAVSSKGARGVMQLMPETAKALGVNINDPKQNIEGGMRFLRGFHDRFKRWDFAVAAYHAGPQAVIRYGGVPPYPETRRFVAAVLGTSQRQASASPSRRSVSRPEQRAPSSPTSASTQGRIARSLPNGFQWPVRGIVTSEFGWRGRHHHDGIDIAADLGTPIHASKAGRVTFAGRYYGYGLMVMIDHGGGQETRYGHASALLVEPDEIVQAGQIIARVGCTGACTAPHVHFEVRIDGQVINPMGPLTASSQVPADPESTSGVRKPRALQPGQEQITATRGILIIATEDEDDDEEDGD